MQSTIRLRRRVAPGAVGPTQLSQGELAYTDPSTGGNGLGPLGAVDFLTVGHGGVTLPNVLVGANRQLELHGQQIVATGAPNAKTFDVSNFRLTGGGQANADLLSTDGNGNLGWVDLGDLGGLTGIIVSAPLTPTTGTNVGTTGNPLGLTMADAAQITAGTNTVFPISSAGLRGVTGDLATLTTAPTARGSLVDAINDVVTTIGALDIGVTTNASLEGDGTSVAGQALRIAPASALQVTTGTDNVQAITSLRLREVTGSTATLDWATTPTLAVAINEIRDQVVLLQSGVQLVGTYNAPTNMVVNPKPGTLSPGALPTATTGMTGWYLNVAGFGVTALPIAGTVGTPMAPGDRVECDGTQWIHTDMGMSAMAATGVAFSPIAAPNPVITATNVQLAIEQLNTAALRTIHLDTDVFSGDGLTVTTPLTIAAIDGGTY